MCPAYRPESYRDMMRCLTLWLWVALLAPGVSAAVAGDRAAFFEQRIRPVLVAHCYECHSAESKVLKAGLLLDTRAGLLRGGDSGPAVVAGKPDDSPLIQALRQDGYEMPPAGKLPDAVVADFERWVSEGAVDPREGQAVARPSGIDVEAGRKFWAFQPPRDVPPSQVKDSAWPQGDVDRFILARLESQHLHPSPQVDRGTLLRRATFDLIGLPPTPEELEAFESDTRPDAFARVVDRLLASPQFGERWGRHWLDVARFAESSGGGRSLVFKDAWRYRDYVIRSFNADKPFNRFLTEQLAGDLLPAEGVEQAQDHLVATGFWMLGAVNYEEQDKRALQMDVVDEQLDTLGRAVLGMTIGCARCHDHKFDPIPTRDYYALAGILRSTRMLFNQKDNVSHWMERPLPLPTAEDQQWNADKAELAVLETRMNELQKELVPVAHGSIAVADLPGIVVDDSQAKAVGTWIESTSLKTYVGSGYLHDANEQKGEKTVTFVPEFPQAGTYEVRLAYTANPDRAAHVPVEILHLDGEFEGHVDQRRRPPIDGRFVSLGRFRFDESNQWFVRISNADTQGVVIVDAVQFLPVENAAPAKTQDDPAAEPKKAEMAALERRLKDLHERVERRPLVMAVEDDEAIADCAVCIRGNIDQQGETVPRGFLQVASTATPPVLPSTESGRRELAAWVARPDHPLTSRVIVNRVWHYLFGAGLVRTVDNFGRTGETPSHPELLDHLALRFTHDGWSIKHLIRTLMLSRTYQQASAARADLATVDPDNRLLGRMNRRRLDAEALRDAMLLAAGQLDLTVGGPTIHLPQKDAKGQGAIEYSYVFHDTRRSVYTPVFRNRLLELFETFDFADPNSVGGQRNTSTVAPQALYLLNSSFVIEQAHHAGERLVNRPAAGDAERVDYAFRVLLARGPSEGERKIALKAVFQRDGEGPVQRGQRWERLCQALFASLDFRYLD
jgi:uncharacterized protein DUF1553/uncharacterized protein DUF1549/cytochrome c